MKASLGSSKAPIGISYTMLIFNFVTALFISSASAAPSDGGYEVCQSEGCKDIANEYLSSMDPTIDPCNDFYRYACGNWAKNHPLAVHSNRWTHFGIIANKTNFRLKEILETGWIDGEAESVRKAKQLYRACMDEQTIENRGTSAIHSFLQLNGGWPVITDSWMERSPPRSWQSVDSYYNKILGRSPIFGLAVTQDLKDSAKHVLSIGPPSAGDPNPTPISKTANAIFKNPAISKYKDFVTEVVKAMAKSGRSTVREAQLEEDVKGIILFEVFLKSLLLVPVNLTSTVPDFRSIQKSMTIAEFQAVYDSAKPQTPKSQINWLQRIKELFANINSVSIDSSERIQVMHQFYFEKLVTLLDRTSERDIVNTIHWWFVKQTIGHTNREMAEISDRYVKSNLPAGSSTPQTPPRWLRCVAGNELQHALSYAYVQKHFPDNAKETALEMVDQIKNEMKKQIIQAKWLDDETKKAAHEKITHMAKFIGFPDWYNDPATLDERYRKLAIGSFYLENMLLVKQFTLKLKLESLKKPVDKWTWIASPVAVNAFYSPIGNSLTFPAGILQMPFFDAGNPDSVNYGGIGSVIAHEISHGFDNVGSQFDKDGNAKDWWSSTTKKEFTKRTQCFVDQFNRFKIQLNNKIYGFLGFHTLGENIADSTGMRAAFAAFKTHVKNSDEKDIKLPGLEHFSREQLFFLSFAGAFCENVKKENLLQWVARDPHSAAPFRVVGTLANTEGFAETFKCAKGTSMNPQNKCGIWY